MSIKKVESGIIFCLIVTASLLVIFPLEISTTVKGIIHGDLTSPGSSASAEDGNFPWDADGVANNTVVWDPAFNPHYIEDSNYVVDVGYELVILPGCEIRFNSGLILDVSGTLTADGGDVGITFTSNSTPKNPGDWGGIWISLGHLTILNNCTIEYSSDGVSIFQATTTWGIRDCVIHDVGSGIYMGEASANMGGWDIINNHIFNCSGTGIYSESSELLNIEDNEIFNNGAGVYFGVTGNGPKFPDLRRNKIINNTMDGVGVDLNFATIYDNEISDNGRHGVNLFADMAYGYGSIAMSISNNNITNNSGYGIYSLDAEPGIGGNLIFNNSQEGIYIDTTAGPIGEYGINIIDNDIMNNSDGIFIYGENPLIEENYIANNSGTGINLTSPGGGPIGPPTDILSNTIFNNRVHGIMAIGEEPTIDDNNISFNGNNGIHICDDPSFGPISPLIQGNKLENNTDAGISIDGINPNINNNTILNTSFGIFVEQNANPRIENCRIENPPVFNTGIEIRDSSGNITNVTILDGKCGIYSLNSDFSVYRSRIENWSKDGVVATSGSLILIENTTMSSSLGSSIYISANSHVTTLNSTFDKLDVIIHDPPSNVTIMWWVHIKVNESDGDPAIGAQVWLNNTFGNVVNSSTTNSDGWINWVQATEYVEGFGAVDYNTHVATAVNNSITGVTYSDIDGYKIIYVDLGNVGNFPIQLRAGWNMISLPSIPSDPAINKVLEPIDGKYKTVECYNVTDLEDEWKVYDVDKSFGNDLLEINYTNGIWIYMNVDETLYIIGERLVTTDIPLKKGWNFIGYPSLTSRLLADALSSISGEYDAVYHYDANDILDPWKYNHDGDLTDMKPGKGYWIYILNDCILTIDG